MPKSTPRSRPRRPAATAWSCCSRGSDPGAAAEPSSTSSSPVDSTATRARRNDARPAGVDAGEHPGDGRRTTVPASNNCGRRRCTSSPTPRTDAPAATDRCDAPRRRRRAARCPRPSPTASAPRWHGAPVMMRTASPAPTTRSVDAPAATSATTRQSTGTSATSMRHAPRSRRRRCWRTAARPPAATTASASTNPTAVGNRRLDRHVAGCKLLEHVRPGPRVADHVAERYRVRR